MYKRARKIFLNYIPTLIKTGLLYKWPYLYPFLEIEPTSCMIMVTGRCNLKCVMCKQWRESRREELTNEDWKEIIKELKENGIKNIHFTGGEPLLREDLRDLISYSSQNGFVTGLTTNGILLRRDVLAAFIDSGLRSIAVSMDAVGEMYEKMRGLPGSFKIIEDAIKATAEIKRNRGVDAYINFTLMKSNIGELKKVKVFADGIGLPIAVCLLDRASSLFLVVENKKEFWISDNKDFEDLEELLSFLKDEKAKDPGSLIMNYPGIDFIREYFKDPRQTHIPCVSSQDRIIIDPYGNLLGGCMAMGNFGNVKERSFGRLRREARYKTAKRNMFYKKCPGCSCGYLFNIRCSPGLIVNDMTQRAGHILFKDGLCSKKN